MLPLFRKIRWRLASENQFLKYSRYAIGEIVLVVIGILIALQINTWNKNRVDRIEEQTYLKRLVENLNRDLANLESVRRQHEGNLIFGTQILDSLGVTSLGRIEVRPGYQNALNGHSDEDIEIPETMGALFFNTLTIRIFYKSDIAFQELLSTGKLDLIQNQVLRSSIQEHYLKATEAQSFQDKIVLTIQNNFRESLNDNNISTLNQESLSEIMERIENAEDLVVATENFMGITEAILNMFIYGENSVKKGTEQLIDQISAEIDNN